MGFFGGGASVDLASPPAIGNTTPNTGAFTTLSANNGTITTSSPAFTLAQTWNAGAQTFTALRVNATDTASASGSLLMDLQVGGISRFKINKNGLIIARESTTASQAIIAADNGGTYSIGYDSGGFYFRINNAIIGGFGLHGSTTILSMAFGSTHYLGWQSGSWGGNTDPDLKIFRDAAGILAQRNSTNAQTFRLYNTFTDASNYERGFMRWATNVLEIGAEAAGTGTQRQLRFPLGTVTASTPLSITQTWNSAGVTFTGLQLNATDTASASGSLLMDLQVGGVSQFTFRKNGIACLRFGFAAGSDVGIECYSSNDSAMSRTVSARCNMLGGTSSGLRLSSGHAVSWSSNNGSTADVFQNNDLFILRDTANILAQRNSTNAQIFRLYRTFTDASNYERLGFIATRTTRFAIAAENAGTGAARSLEISFYTSASDPASTDITDGCFSVWKNSGTGTIKLWANDGGTMKSVALA